MSRRPLSITIIGWLFIGVGCVTLVRHLSRFIADLAQAGTRAASAHALRDVGYAGASALVALIGGVYLLRGRTWARWLCALWLAFHVFLSMGHSIEQLVVHVLLFAGIAYLLFRR